MPAPALMANLAKNLPVIMEALNAAQSGAQVAQMFGNNFPNHSSPTAVGGRPNPLGGLLGNVGSIMNGATDSVFGVMTLNPFKALGGAHAMASNAAAIGYKSTIGQVARPMADLADTAAYGTSFTMHQASQFSNRQGESMALQAAGNAVQAFTKKLGDAVTDPSFEKLADIAVSIVNLVPLFESMGDAIAQDIKRLDGLGGSVSYANRVMEQAKLQEGIREATSTGGTSVQVVKALVDLKKEMEPMRHDISNLVNVGLTQLLGIGKSIMKYVNSLWDLTKDLAPHIPLIGGYAKQMLDQMEKAEREGKVEAAKAARNLVERTLIGNAWADPKKLGAKRE